MARSGEPFSSPGHVSPQDLSTSHLYMKAETSNQNEQEPMGIIISRGPRREQTPRFFAYVWAPAPETEETSSTKAA